MKKRTLSLLLAAALTCCLAPVSALAAGDGLSNFTRSRTYAPGQFTDVPGSAWYAENVAAAYELGLVNGSSQTTYSPSANLTMAEVLSLASRLHSIYHGGDGQFVQGTPWYQVYVDYAAQQEIFAPDGSPDLTAPATRSQFASILAKALPALALPQINAVADSAIPDVSMSADYAGAVYLLYRAGVLTGTDSGTFAPDAPIQRSEVAAIVTRMADPALRRSVSNLAPDPSATLTVAGTDYYVGMSEATLLDLAGEPEDTLETVAGYTWYVYGTKTYKDFFMAGMYDGQVVTLCSSGTGFTYLGHKMGDTDLPQTGGSAVRATLYTDSNNNDIFHCVLLTGRDSSYSGNLGHDAARLLNESKVDFHLVNAFRSYHGLDLLAWSDKAAASARLHSEDMAANNYFDHISQDGRSPWERMGAQGISFRGAAENISAGRSSGVESHDGWVNSSGHRSNILSGSLNHMGVGAAYAQDSIYRYYFTENFYY